MELIDMYIIQQFRAIGLELESGELDWNLGDGLEGYVNASLIFTRERLLPVMEVTLTELAQKPGNEARCERSRRYLSLWIQGLQALSEREQNYSLLPYMHRQNSGRFMTLICPDYQALLQLTDEDFLAMTGQMDVSPAQQIPRGLFAKTVSHWIAFMTHLGEKLADISRHCYHQLNRFFHRCNFDERRIRRFQLSIGHIDVTCRPQKLSEIDICEFDPDYLVQYIDKVAEGIVTPVCVQATVFYNNGIEMESFLADVDVDNLDSIPSYDYHEVVADAIEWVRVQFDVVRAEGREGGGEVMPIPLRPKIAA